MQPGLGPGLDTGYYNRMTRIPRQIYTGFYHCNCNCPDLSIILLCLYPAWLCSTLLLLYIHTAGPPRSLRWRSDSWPEDLPIPSNSIYIATPSAGIVLVYQAFVSLLCGRKNSAGRSDSDSECLEGTLHCMSLIEYCTELWWRSPGDIPIPYPIVLYSTVLYSLLQ